MKFSSFVMAGLVSAELTAMDRLTRVNTLLSTWIGDNVNGWKR